MGLKSNRAKRRVTEKISEIQASAIVVRNGCCDCGAERLLRAWPAAERGAGRLSVRLRRGTRPVPNEQFVRLRCGTKLGPGVTALLRTCGWTGTRDGVDESVKVRKPRRLVFALEICFYAYGVPRERIYDILLLSLLPPAAGTSRRRGRNPAEVKLVLRRLAE